MLKYLLYIIAGKLILTTYLKLNNYIHLEEKEKRI